MQRNPSPIPPKPALCCRGWQRAARRPHESPWQLGAAGATSKVTLGRWQQSRGDSKAALVPAPCTASAWHSTKRNSPEGTRAKTTQGKQPRAKTRLRFLLLQAQRMHIYTHTHRARDPDPNSKHLWGFSFIPWGQRMRICLQLSTKGLHSPAVLSSFHKQSAGTGWQRSPGHQVLSHSRIHRKKKKKTKLAFAPALQQKEKVTAWVWGMSALPASCHAPQISPPAPRTKPKQAPKG